MRIAVIVAGALTLGACTAGLGSGGTRYDRELAALEQDCRARNGFLRPIGVRSALPAQDYVCDIRSQAPPPGR